jgi:hypothetical protein
MPSRSIVSTVIRLLLLSLLVGMVLAFLDVTPESLLTSFGGTVERIFRIVVSFASWALRYVMVGAILVVPIWLVMMLLRLSRRGGKP